MGFRRISKAVLRREKRKARQMAKTTIPQPEFVSPAPGVTTSNTLTWEEAKADVTLAGYAVWDAVTRLRHDSDEARLLAGVSGWIYNGSRDKLLTELWGLTTNAKNYHDPFRADLSKYLRGSKNMVCIQRGGPFRTSQWWVSDSFNPATAAEARRKSALSWWKMPLDIETRGGETVSELLELLICPECRDDDVHRQFGGKQPLAVHRNRIHAIKGTSISAVQKRRERETATTTSKSVERREAIQKVATAPATTPTIHRCSKCPLETTNERTYISHVNRTDHATWSGKDAPSFRCPQCPNEVRVGVQNFRGHLNKKHGQTYCDKCDEYMTVSAMSTHRTRHGTETIYAAKHAKLTTTADADRLHTPGASKKLGHSKWETTKQQRQRTGVYELEDATKEITVIMTNLLGPLADEVTQLRRENEQLADRVATVSGNYNELKDKNVELTGQLAKYRELAKLARTLD